MKESLYIKKRQLQAKLLSLQFFLCRIFPIKRNLIVVCTFEGKGGFGCNPKYVVKALHEKHPDLEFVWLVNQNAMDKNFPDYVKKVENSGWKRAYYLTRAKAWIDNYRKPYGTVKRKGQYYLNTNHYTLGIKTVGLWRGAGFSKMAYLVSKNDSDMIDDLIIDSKFGEIMSPKGLVYEGAYLKTGAPRCDVLFGDRTEKKRAYRRHKKLPEDAKILMFAPTFREGAKNGKRFVYSEEWSLDFSRLIKSLEESFGGKWYICFRVHPQLASAFQDYKNLGIQERIINESQADDLYEILAAMDAFITDYSSACFEAGFAKIPVFIYADDIKQYEQDRGSLFWNMAENTRGNVTANQEILRGLEVTFPFTIATNNSELEADIKGFNRENYERRLDQFHADLGLVFTGHASEDVTEKLELMLNK